MSVETITFAEYLARPALSASGAKKLLKAPALYRWDQDNPSESTTAFDIGRAFHTDVLGDGDPIEAINEGGRASKAFKTAATEARAAGRTPVTLDEYLAVKEMSAAVKRHRLASQLLSKGDPEKSWFFTDPATGAPCKARTDWLTRMNGQLVIVDAKSALSADPGEFRRSAATFGYHIQDAMHRAAVQSVMGEDVDFMFIAVEKKPPYLVSVVELDDVAKARGEELVARAQATYARCIKTGEWPGYPPNVSTISLPAWAFDDDTEDMVV